MTDLSKGILEVEGITLSQNTKASDFDNVVSSNVKVEVSKRGHTYNGFEKNQNPVEGETGNARIKNQVKGNTDNLVEAAGTKKEPTTKASDEASKGASDQVTQNVAPKPNGIGM